MTNREFNKQFIENDLQGAKKEIMRADFIDQPMIRAMYAAAIDSAARGGRITQRQASDFDLPKIKKL